MAKKYYYKVEGVNGYSKYFDTKAEAMRHFRQRNKTWQNMNAVIKLNTTGQPYYRETIATNGGYNV